MTAYDESLAAALKRAVQDAQELISAEVALAKAELRAEVRRIAMAAGALAGAAVAALMALVFVLTAAAWGIADWLEWPAWAGFAGVALVLALAAAALGLIARARVVGRQPMPLTVETLKENAQWMRARTS
jgi:hypothetical protein